MFYFKFNFSVLFQGLSEAKVDKIKEAVNKLHGDIAFQTALEVSYFRKNVFRLSTGSQEFK